MKTFAMLLMLGSLLGLAGCGEENFNPPGTAAPKDDVPEGGPERSTAETPSEAAVPEWEERESGEVADGDQ